MTYGTMSLNPCSSAALQIPYSAWSNPLPSVHLAPITASSHLRCSTSNKTPQACHPWAPNVSICPDSMSPDLWERLCYKSFPLLAEQLIRNADQQPDSWRDQYFVCTRHPSTPGAVSHPHSSFARPRHTDSKKPHQGSEISAWKQMNARENERLN